MRGSWIILLASMASSVDGRDASPAGRPPGEPPDGLSLGLATAVRSDIYVGDDNPANLLPTIVYRRGRWMASAAGLDVRLHRHTRGEIGLALRARRSTLDESDSVELAGIDRSLTGDLGVTGRLRTGFVLWSGSALREITGEHGGFELQLQAGVPLPLPFAKLRIGGGLRFESETLADYRYGVRPDEARADRPPYRAADALVPFVSLHAMRLLGEHWQLVGSVRTSFLPPEATDSPIVDQTVEVQVLAGVSYRF